MFIENKKTWTYFKLEASIPSTILIQYYQVANTIESINIFVITFNYIVLLVQLSN